MVLNWISVFLWWIPEIGPFLDIILNIAMLIHNAQFNFQLQRLIDFYNDENSYYNTNFFKKTWEDKMLSYGSYDLEYRTNISNDIEERKNFEDN